MKARTRKSSISIKRIMCPVDFSESSLKALHSAYGLTRYFKAELFVIHVIQPVSTIGEESQYNLYDFDTPRYEDKVLRNTRKRLRITIEQEIGRTSRVHIQVRAGEASRVIIRTAAKKQIDLIVMSPHGAGWIKHLLFGSVAEKVIRTAPCPVLVVRGPEEQEDP
ncbi:universal stress protein [candidate division WOR-3 bacterium]|nr:universal stress protein [candidate division WOR-3 bacterium]